MKAKRICPVLLALLCCLLFSAVAFADGPVNPFFSERQPFKLDTFFRVDRSALSVEVSPPDNIQTGIPAVFTAVVTGGSGEYTYRFSIFSLDAENPGYWKWEYGPLEYSANPSLEYTFWAPGEYLLGVEVKDSEGNTGNSMQNYTGPNVIVTGSDLLSAKIGEIIDSCPAEGDYEKALWLHDYLTTHAYYDYNLEYYAESGVLMLNKGVCDSYSRAYNLLLDEFSIGHIRVTSKDHAWNAVCMEGEWYHVDTTWDDPGEATVLISGDENHDFFGLPTEIIEQINIHVINNTDVGPACTAYECNYYVKTGEVPWQESVETAIGDKISEGERDFTLTLPGSYSWKEGDYTYTQEFQYPVINYGINKYLLERDGMEYRDRAMDLSATYNVTVPLVMDISAHFALNETDAVFTLPSGLQTLEREALESTNAVVVFIPNGCGSIGNLALANMQNLDEVHIPDSVTEIDPDAFSDCRENLLIVAPRNSAAAAFAVDKEFCLEFS